MNKLFFVLCIFLVLVISGCTGDAPEQSQTSTVGTWKTAQTIQPFLYQDYITDDHFVEVLPFTNPGDQKSALLAGDLEMTGTTIALAITAASRGEPVVVVSALCNKCSAIVVREDSDILEPADLKGKTIAYVPGTMHHVLLLETLKNAGLDPEKDVTLQRIDFFDMGQALSQGKVDAFCSGEPYPSLAIADGYGRVLSYPYYKEGVGTINAGMLTTKDQIENNREEIQELVTAHARATEYLKDNPEEWLSMSSEFGTDPQVLDIASGNMELAWNMDEDYVQQAENLAKRMKELGMIEEVPDMDTLFDLSFVEQARKDLDESENV
ncbi:ABC transporter substrate-binding protein [Methanohalophilus sp. RSK]|uniref:ABC transporter substrate-binding protein n=1 Tax=Methanohalophilus sp. RSK TaxID=2485783 RepID=UPI000F43DEB2|nr:ABC transporter substrate-binding protein [Methanohalophilus sp. RSK]RNI13750.1 ABC transporter substrate-binding protein [Methanohalophilus sp. RSK]